MSFVDILLEDHRQIAVMVDVLDAVAARLAAGRDVPLRLVSDVLEFFDRFAMQHHDLEESVLFPFLARHGIDSDQTAVHALRCQHDAGRAYNGTLRAGLRRFAGGEDGAGSALAATMNAYSELVREHLRIEDEYFYGLADRILTDAEHAEVAKAFGDLHRGTGGAGGRRRYERMVEAYPALVAEWASQA